MKTAHNGMGSWKRRKLVKGMRASQETGRKKGMCPPAINRTLCRRNRSYKSREYDRVMSKYDGNKIRWGSN